MKLMEIWRKPLVEAEVVRAIEYFALNVDALARTSDIEQGFGKCSPDAVRGRMLAEIALDDTIRAVGRAGGLSRAKGAELLSMRHQDRWMTAKTGPWIGPEPEFIACLKDKISDHSLESLNAAWNGIRREIARLSLSEAELANQDTPLPQPIPQAY